MKYKMGSFNHIGDYKNQRKKLKLVKRCLRLNYDTILCKEIFCPSVLGTRDQDRDGTDRPHEDPFHAVERPEGTEQ